MRKMMRVGIVIAMGSLLFSTGFILAQSVDAQADHEKVVLGKIAMAELGSDTYHMGVHTADNENADSDLGKAIVSAGKDSTVTPAVAAFLISSHCNKIRDDREIPDGINTQVQLQAIQVVQNKEIIDLLQKIADGETVNAQDATKQTAKPQTGTAKTTVKH